MSINEENMSDPVRIFIGSSANGEDAQIEIAYEHSIRRNCSRPVEITWMRQTNDTDSIWGGWQTQNWSTPFSGYRWAIPEACNFEGRAIYTDCDMINFKDMAELLDVDLQGKPCAARRGSRFGGHEFCVMVFDCAAMRQHVLPVARQKKIAEAHHRMIGKFSGNGDLVADLDPRWNCLDGEDYSLDDIWQLHFTRMNSQPWQPAWFTGQPEKHRRDDVVEAFYHSLQLARDAGYDDAALQTKLAENNVKYNIIGR